MALPINGETSAHNGGTMNTSGTQADRPRTPRILVMAGSHMPGDIPCRKKTTHITAKDFSGLIDWPAAPCTGVSYQQAYPANSPMFS
jgi:hypothetical protein